jgi:hypothetical protein
MKQDPKQLINDVHERVANATHSQKILSGYKEDPTFWGLDLKTLFVLLLPAMLVFRGASEFLTGTNQLVGYGAGVLLGLIGVVIAAAAPENIRDYVEAVVSNHAHQQEMIHDSDPDESRLEQPKNDSLLGRFARSSFVKDWPLLGAGDYEPTQALIPHKNPVRGKHAVVRDDGWVIVGIRLHSIPLRLESSNVRKQVERTVANALEGTVDYHAEWISTTRVADYESQRTQWKDRAREYQSQADKLVNGGADEVDAIRKQILADIANERAAAINIREETKRVREHYFVVSVAPGEAVIDKSSETGGLGSVPIFRWFVEQWRLRQQRGSEEHISTLIDKVEDRADDIESELAPIEGLTPTLMPSDEFSEVLADYYRATNVRAHDEFTDAIRGSPVPGSEDAGDPDHETDYRHITNRDRAGSSPSPSPTSVHATDGGAVPDESDTTNQPESDTQ